MAATAGRAAATIRPVPGARPLDQRKHFLQAFNYAVKLTRKNPATHGIQSRVFFIFPARKDFVRAEEFPELPEIQDEIEIEIEIEPELPKTSGWDILLLGLGAAVTGGAFVLRRKRK